MLSKLEQAKQILDESLLLIRYSLLLIRYPDNGWHICRWCFEPRKTGCSPTCWYDEHTKAIDTYREKVKAYIASLP